MMSDYIRVYGVDGLVECFEPGGRLEEEGRYNPPKIDWSKRCRTDYCENWYLPTEERNRTCVECGREK